MGYTLASHQLESLRWLRGSTGGKILADVMGLGKTFPAIHAAAAIEGPKLVCCPGFLMGQWEEAIKDYLDEPDADIIIIEGNPAKRTQILEEEHEWYLCTYGLLSSHVKNTKKYGPKKIPRYLELVKKKWAVLIFDEAHHLRGKDSQSTKTVRYMKYDYCWMLTGTPIVKDAGDMFSLLRICDKKRYTSYWRFVQDHCYITETPWLKQIGGMKDPKKFSQEVSKYTLRRKIKDVNIPWPKKIVREIKVDLPSAMKEAYKKAVKEYRFKFGDEDITAESAAALAAKLRRITSFPPVQQNPKLDVVKQIIKTNPNEKIVIFCWYRDTARDLCKALQDHVPVMVTGETPIKHRQQDVAMWKASKKSHILISTIGAIGEGSNLQCSHIGIFVETDWLHAVNDQAMARLVRRGQEELVELYIIMARATLDVRVWAASKKREQLTEKALVREILRTI